MKKIVQVEKGSGYDFEDFTLKLTGALPEQAAQKGSSREDSLFQ